MHILRRFLGGQPWMFKKANSAGTWAYKKVCTQTFYLCFRLIGVSGLFKKESDLVFFEVGK